MSKDNLKVLDILEQAMNGRFWSAESSFKSDLIDEAHQDIKDLFIKCKRFYFSVEEAQNPYSNEFVDELAKGKIHISGYRNFILPFHEVLYTFEHPIDINWALRESLRDTRTDIYQSHDLLGVMIREMPLTEWYEEKHVSDFKKDSKGYRLYLLLLEKDPELDAQYMVSWQWIDFICNNDVSGMMWISHMNHTFFCNEKKICQIIDTGVPIPNSGASIEVKYCQEYANRKAIVEMAISLTHSLYEKEVIKTHKKTIFDYIGFNRSTDDQKKVYTEGSIPTPYYKSYLPDKRYVYDKGEISVGTGTKHGFKYDVRRHPRIVKGRLIWIHPHQRGSGKYIPRLYTKSKVMSVPYLYEKVENLTKFRFFERIMIALIKIYRKLKK